MSWGRSVVTNVRCAAEFGRDLATQLVALLRNSAVDGLNKTIRRHEGPDECVLGSFLC